MKMTTHLTESAIQAIIDVEAHIYESSTAENNKE